MNYIVSCKKENILFHPRIALVCYEIHLVILYVLIQVLLFSLYLTAAQFGVMHRNLSLAMAGTSPKHNYDGYTSCPLVTGTSKHLRITLIVDDKCKRRKKIFR